MHKNNSNTYETYYEHLCTVPNEKDVLQIDIVGKHFKARLRRFWYELFLLSYTNNSARRFYLSSHAMRIARIVQFRHYRSCIHPLSKFRTFWDFMMMYVVLINRVLFHYNSSMIHNTSVTFHYIALALEIIIIMDLFVNCFTAYFIQNTKQLVMDLHRIVINYVSTNAFVHFASAIPLEALMFLRYGDNINCSECKCTLFVGTLKIISLVTTIRIFQVTTCWKRQRRSFKITSVFKFIRIFVLGIFIMLQILTLSDALSIIYIINHKMLDHRSYIAVVLMFKHNTNFDDNAFMFFCLELSRICKSFLLFGYGLYPNETSFDRLSALVSFMLAYAFHIWSFLGCYACVTRAVFTEEQLLLSQYCTLNILRARQLPDIINTKIMRYYQCNMSKMTVTERQNGLFIALPPALKMDIKMSCYRSLVMRLPFFAEWPLEVINALVPLLNEEVYLGKDIVASAWSRSDGLIILESGLLAVYSVRLEETGHLIDGDYFGELSLVTDKEIRMSTVIAVTYCRVLFLDKSPFRKVMRKYPVLFFEMKEKFKEIYGTNEQEMTEA